jgi:6-phosphofructokinase 1
MKKHNLCYAQSGGVTAVINTSAAAVIAAAKTTPAVHRVYAAQNGILGVLNEELIETWHESGKSLRQLEQTPGGAFGSCRVKLPDPNDDLVPYARLMDVFAAHDIRYFLYNGGNDSADTAMKLSAAARTLNYPLVVVGVPKTIDNDLAATDTCPGFPSAAKYVAVSIAETMLDVASMSATSTKVFVLEVMGRHAGWLAAAAGMAVPVGGGALMILPPEVPWRRAHFVATLHRRVKKYGYAAVVVSEGLCDSKGNFLSADGTDQFAHHQLGGVAPIIADVAKHAGYKCHWGVADYMQRAARHIASAVDAKQAVAVGEVAVQLAVQGKNAYTPVIRRLSDSPYRWRVEATSLKKVANRERRNSLALANVVLICS